MDEIWSVKDFLHCKFGIKDLSDLKYFLGLEIARSSKGILLNQHKYALELLEDSGLLASKPSSTSMDSTSLLSKATGTQFTDLSSYRRLVGKLLYLITTRPDISFNVQQLSQFLSYPTNVHHKAVVQVLHYIKHSPAQGLFFPSSLDLKLQAFSNSDWGGCPDSRNSITSYCIFLGPSLIS